MNIHFFRRAWQYDSCLLPLDDNTFGLILQFRVKLVRIEPTSHFYASGTYGTGNGILHDTDADFHLQSWTDLEWETYKRDFVGTIRNHWDGKFILSPNKPWYRPRLGSALISANIQCGLSIELVETSAQAHQTYRIIHPVETDFRSFADAPNRSGLFTHMDLDSRWISRPTRMGTVIHNVSFLQTTVSHEFGHTMGLNHVNGVGNGDSNYGITLAQRENQMGMGGLLTASHARPWINRLRYSHLINQNHQDTQVHFTGRVADMQLIEYWDDDWQPPAPATT